MNEGDSVVVGTVCNVHNLLSYGVVHIFKVGKSFVRPREEWVVVGNVFEPLVERELWERVQEGFANPTTITLKCGCTFFCVHHIKSIINNRLNRIKKQKRFLVFIGQNGKSI